MYGVAGGLEPISTVTGQEAEFTLDRSIVFYRLLTPTGILELPCSLHLSQFLNKSILSLYFIAPSDTLRNSVPVGRFNAVLHLRALLNN